jgi:diacylglycerol O-acyltransferase / wax synthase
MDKPLQRIDHLMWDAETPNSLVTIAGIMTFKKPLNRKKLTDTITKRLLRFERFQKRVIMKEGNPHWHLDEYFKLKTHIHHIALPGKGGYAELQECVSDLISQQLNYNKPLWDIHLIDNYKGGSVLLWRLHHAIGDGISLVKVVFSLTGKTARESLAPDETGWTMPRRKKIADNLDQLVQLGRSAYEDGMHMLRNPSLFTESIRNTWRTTKEISELFLGRTVDNTIYKGHMGLVKKAAWAGPFELDTFKKVAKKYDVKINDVLLALVAGAFRKHLITHKQKVKDGMKIIVPVNLRKDHEAMKLHNEFSFISLDLPIHISSFEKRIRFISEKTTALKPSAEPLLLNEMLHLLADYTPMAVQKIFMEFMGKHIAGVISNVPGPDHPVYLAGSEVEDLMFWIPHTVSLGIGISLMSYNKKVYMGLVVDEGLVNDPEVLVNTFEHELKMQKKLLVRKKAAKV